jgi:hypothetical protein
MDGNAMSRGDADRMSTGPDRREIRIATLRTGAAILVVGVVYGFLPVDSGPILTGVVAVVVGLLALGVLLVVQLRRIVTHPRPMLRAAEALAMVVPLFVTVFAWSYVLLSHADPGAFTEPLDRVSALYFTVTVLSTVGFGDIAPLTHEARLLVTGQIVVNLTLLVAAIRLILAAARAGHRRAE